MLGSPPPDISVHVWAAMRVANQTAECVSCRRDYPGAGVEDGRRQEGKGAGIDDADRCRKETQLPRVRPAGKCAQPSRYVDRESRRSAGMCCGVPSQLNRPPTLKARRLLPRSFSTVAHIQRLPWAIVCVRRYQQCSLSDAAHCRRCLPGLTVVAPNQCEQLADVTTT